MTLQAIIENAWENRLNLTFSNAPKDLQNALTDILLKLDTGELRIAEKINAKWYVHQWLKKAILLSFKIRPSVHLAVGVGNSYDKVALKYATWTEQDFNSAGFRAVPGAIVRHPAYIASNVVIMPSFINVGAYIDTGTMIDSWATVGSCAQIGQNCHISANVLIGGVLEPLQAEPVIIEDHCFIGAGSSIVEGIIVEQGAVIGMGVSLGASTPIIDRASSEISYGRIPSNAVVINGSIPSPTPSADGLTLHLTCAVIVKRVDEKTRSKTGINELLRAL